MSDDTLETLRSNINDVTKKIVSNPHDSTWVENVAPGKSYIEKKYVIEDFGLKVPSNPKDIEVILEDSIILYEHLKELPKYVLTDERFWSWVNFEKGYEAALAMMPVKEGNSVFKDHWLFTQGKRRGLFFGVLSRCYFRVDLTVEDDPKNPYELTKFVIGNPERFRNLSWRAFSNQRHIVRGVLRAEKQIYDEYGFENNDFYPEIAKYVSKMGSVMLLDVMDESSIQKQVYKELEKLMSNEVEKAFAGVL